MNLKQIARAANVSPTTVSRALNGKINGYMRHETYERVKKLIDEIGYVPHALASGLRRGVASTIGVVVPDISNPYYATICRYVEEACLKSGYSTFICNSDLQTEKEQHYLSLLKNQKVAGIILANFGLRAREIFDSVHDDTKIVCFDDRIPEYERHFVGVDNYKGGYLAARYLAGLGHKRIVILVGPDRYTASQERLIGFKNGIHESGLSFGDCHVAKTGPDYASAVETVKSLVHSNLSFSAIFTFNDLMAIGAIKALTTEQIEVPRAVSVLGYDNIAFGEMLNPSLSTISTPIRELSAIAVENIVSLVKGIELVSKETILQPELIERESCSVCRDHN